MRWLFTAVVLMHQARSARQVVIVHGHDQLIDNVGHKTLPWFGPGPFVIIVLIGQSVDPHNTRVARRRFRYTDPLAEHPTGYRGV